MGGMRPGKGIGLPPWADRLSPDPSPVEISDAARDWLVENGYWPSTRGPASIAPLLRPRLPRRLPTRVQVAAVVSMAERRELARELAAARAAKTGGLGLCGVCGYEYSLGGSCGRCRAVHESVEKLGVQG